MKCHHPVWQRMLAPEARPLETPAMVTLPPDGALDFLPDLERRRLVRAEMETYPVTFPHRHPPGKANDR